MKTIGLAVALLAGAPALASSSNDTIPDHVLLWKNTYSGISEQQFTALYPDRVAELSPNCPVKILRTFKKDRLYRVILVLPYKRPDCATSAYADLKAKYGEGEEDTKSVQKGSGIIPPALLGFQSTKINRTTWKKGAVTIHWTTMGYGGQANIFYTVEPNPKFHV